MKLFHCFIIHFCVAALKAAHLKYASVPSWKYPRAMTTMKHLVRF